jgi:phosphoribosylamine---glycine ligase
VTVRRVLVVGDGAREHALCWRLRREPDVADVHAAPGSAGMAGVATIHPEVSETDVEAVVRLARQVEADLVVVGPEAPLAAGLADRLIEHGVAVFGPTAAAAQLETSKAFCRSVAESIGVPMSEGRAFSHVEPAVAYAHGLGAPVVVKADGLARGKGVVVCQTLAEAEAAIEALGPRVVVERCLVGAEASLMAICDGARAVALPAARDYKRVGEGDTGPNTGGMGAYSPLPDVDAATVERLLAIFHRPVLAEMARRGTPFRGLLYAGLMLTGDGPYLLEFNCRFGDPETEAVLPVLRGNLTQALAEASAGRLTTTDLTADGAAVAVALAAHGYPAPPRTGDRISGLAESTALVFHGATRLENGGFVTAAGRPVTVVGTGADVSEARERAYDAAASIHFDGMHYRCDIAAPALAKVGA